MQNKIGYLEILDKKREPDKNGIKRTYYYCKCNLCGSKTWIRADGIKSGKQTSCGCLSKKTQFKILDIKGKKFTRLTVIEQTGKKASNGSAIWMCKCDCGNTIETSANALQEGRIQSCGCLSREIWTKQGEKIGQINVDKNVVDNTHIGNIKRSAPLRTNKTGFKGVSYDKSRKKYKAQIDFKKKHYNLGRFDTAKEASDAYQEAKKKMHGEFLEWYEKNIRQVKNESKKNKE